MRFQCFLFMLLVSYSNQIFNIDPYFGDLMLRDIQFAPSVTTECDLDKLEEITSVSQLRELRPYLICYWANGSYPKRTFYGTGAMYMFEMNNQMGLATTFYETYIRTKIIFNTRCLNKRREDISVDIGTVFGMNEVVMWFHPVIDKVQARKKLHKDEYDDGEPSLLFYYDEDWKDICPDEITNDRLDADFSLFHNKPYVTPFYEATRKVGNTKDGGTIWLIRVMLHDIDVPEQFVTIGWLAMVSYDTQLVEFVKVTPKAKKFKATAAGISNFRIPLIQNFLLSSSVRDVIQYTSEQLEKLTTFRPMIPIPRTIINNIFSSNDRVNDSPIVTGLQNIIPTTIRNALTNSAEQPENQNIGSNPISGLINSIIPQSINSNTANSLLGGSAQFLTNTVDAINIFNSN